MSEIQTKHLGPLEIKNEERGEVEAVICTLNVVDHDREVVLPGAIKDGSKVKLSSYGHSAVFGDAPVGKGTVRVIDDRALLNAQFFMATQRGRESFETVKALGPDSEWSIGFVPTKFSPMTKEWEEKGASRLLAAIDLFECSPVLRGASPDTMTLAVKEAVKQGVKEGVGEVAEEAKEADQEAAAARQAEADAAAEAELVEAERKAAEDAAAREAEEARLADEAEAQRQKEEIAQKQRVAEAMEEYYRVQRALKRMRLA